MDRAEPDIPSAYIVKNHIYEAAYEATMQDSARSRETNTAKDTRVAKPNQPLSTAGFETIEAKELVDLIQGGEATSCTKDEIPHSTISVLTALMDDLPMATEDGMTNLPLSIDDMTNVPLSSDDESDDDWSVVSGGSDFVVIDSAETARHISNDRSKKKPEAPRRPSRQAGPRTPSVGQQSVVVDQNARKEPVTASAVHDSRREQLGHRQQRDSIKETGNLFDRLVELHTKGTRALSRAQELQEAYYQERDSKASL
jgi:hypothetical protein